MRLERGKIAFIAIGLAGCLSGVFVANIAGSDPATPAEVPSLVPDVSLPPSTSALPSVKEGLKENTENALLDIVRQIHGRLSDSEVGGESNIPPEFSRILRAQKTYQPILRDFFNEVGSGVFVTQGKLTPSGRAVLTYAATITDHGLKPKHYPIDKVKALIREFQPSKSQDSDIRSMNTRQRTLRALLLDDNFDDDRVAKTLANMRPAATAKELQDLETQLKKGSAAPPRLPGEIAADIDTARILMHLVLDFKIFRRSGPFRPLTNKSEAFALWKKRPGITVAHMVDVALAEKPLEAIQNLEPSRPSYDKLVQLHKRYRQFAANQCHKRLNPEWRLQVGRKGSEVRELQKRLACEGLYTGPIHGNFDEPLKEAVMTYQKHHALNDEGFVKKGTINSMNVSMAQRAAQIGLVLQRMRESEAERLGDSYIRVNVPAFELNYVENNKVIRSHDVIVGTNRLDDNKLKLVQGHLNRTRLFTTELYEVVVNPDWVLPERVEKGEVRTKLASDPNYLAKNNIRRITLPSGKSALVQGRGELNVLGKVKFHLKESNAIFLHDTNDRSLFRHAKRDLSHGCVRVKHAEKFAKWLLDKDGWDAGDVKRTFKAEKTQRGMKLKKPVPLITEYMTVAVSDEGHPIFYRDVYGYDKAYFKGLLPATTEVRWGDANLRPAWVPRVPKDIVEEWRRRGKAAPQNYKPPPT
jgi:L,D-transpeptidase YcbB